MERSNGIQPEKYKHVIDEEGGRSWIKEKAPDGTAYRHQIETGPRGGKYFENSDGNKVYVNTVRDVVKVWKEDSL